MEAIAAAGALPGLASATIQLGTATFQFYQQLHSLYKAIKHGENDLKAAIRRLDQHGDFIKELRFNFERIPGPGVSASTRDLFESYITDSEAEVEEFKNLLNRVSKQHFRKKSLQAVETGSRLRFYERSIQKYCDLLDKQIQRFLFLQSSAQSMRIESTLSEVLDTLVNQGAKATAFYDEQSSREINEELSSQLGARSNEIQLPLRRAGESSYTAPFLRRDVIPGHWGNVQFKRYLTLCGTVSVTKFSDLRTYNARDYEFAYKVTFEPYGWISRTLVEWRCLISSAHRIPTLMLSVTTGIICEDPDVIDALGLVACTASFRYSYRWACGLHHFKIPNISKVRALLHTGRLLKAHIVCKPHSRGRTDILTACFWLLATYDCELKTFGDACCSSWSSAELLRYYHEFYNVIELLLSRGFEPTLSSWGHLYYQAVLYRWRVSRDRPALISTLNQKSISALILNTCGYFIPVNVLVTVQEQSVLWAERLFDVSVAPKMSYLLHNTSYAGSSHLGHFIALQLPLEIIIRETKNLDLLDLADEQHTLDRWLLGLFAPHRPEVASLLQQCLKSYKTTAVHKRFEVEYIREEFKQRTNRPDNNRREDLLKFISVHGNAAILQQLDLTALTEWEINFMLISASQNSCKEIFDILISHMHRMPNMMLLHTKMIRERLAADPVFLSNFFASPSNRELLSIFIRDSFSSSLLFEIDSHPLPAYMRNFAVGLVRIYEMHPTVTESVVHSLIYYAIMHHWSFSESAEYFLQNLHLYWLLDLIAHSSAFRSLLDISNPKNVDDVLYNLRGGKVYFYPSVNGYSPLMLALRCGMRPAVQILVDAGASILTPSSCGKSPLSVAYEHIRAQHPRKWAAKYNQAGQLSTSGFDGRECTWGICHRGPESMWVSESTDKEMLEILLKALRDRGEAIEEGVDELPMRSKWDILREKTRYYTRWLFEPYYTFDPDTFRENSIYAILVSTLWFVSVLKVLKAELGDYPAHVAGLLSRPVVILALVVLILSILW